MKNYSTQKIVLSSLVIFTLIGSVYSLNAPKIYSSKSHVAIFRLKIENPDNSSDESRNRWIWIRDGLSLKSALVTDSIIETIAQSDETLKEMASSFDNKQLFNEHIKKFINVQFTGADENNFIIEVKAPTSKLALDLNTLLFDRIKYLATKADQKKFNELVTVIKKKQHQLIKDQAGHAFYDDKIRKLTFNHILEQKQKEEAFQVISKPTINDQPIWPRHKLLIGIFALIGLAFGLGLDYVLKSLQREK